MSQTLSTQMAATVRASNQGLELVDKARNRKGWNKTEQAWADIATTSKATLRRFWGGINIQTEAFRAICEAVGIEDWESIADFEAKDDAPSKVYEKRLSFAIAGSIEEIDKQKLDAIVALLRKLGGDAEIEILDIEEGSVKLTLGGSEKALHRLQELFDSGGLQEVEGLSVQGVHLLTKEEIIEPIKNKTNYGQNLIRADLIGVHLFQADLFQADLREADLSGANLREADLRQADLSGVNLHEADLSRAHLFQAHLFRAYLFRAHLFRADLRKANLREADLSRAYLNEVNLSGADLHRTIVNRTQFINTQGISAEDKFLLIQGGAIFKDSPNSPDRVLVSR
ncbi:MAG: pentapeptide repeat-containing protein [Cyanobacteria bacterium P01_F01_bin.53]